MSDHATMNSPAAPLPQPKPQNGIGGYIFLNQGGLRSGWRLLVYAAFVCAIFLVGSQIEWMFVRPERNVFSYSNQFAFELVAVASVLGAALLMSKIERRTVGEYGLPFAGIFGRELWWGCVFGFCEMSSLIALISAFGGYSLGPRALNGMEIAQWGFLWLVLFVLVGFFEEFFFRGYTLFTLKQGIGFWPAAIVLSACFGAVHIKNDGENWVGILGVFVVGLFWCFTVRRTGTLWFAVGMHVAFDFSESFLYSVPDSGAVLPGHLTNATMHGPAWLTGGVVGPEASVFDFIILVAYFFLFHFMFPARNDRVAPANLPPANS